MAIDRLRVVDSHTEGEPTRTLVGTLAMPGDSVQAKAEAWRGRFDPLRRALCLEPRGWSAVVGCHVSEPTAEGCDYDVVFFNNVGVLGMCGHGTIGLLATLADEGRLRPGPVRLNTVAGVVEAELLEDGRARVANVPSWADRRVEGLEAPGLGPVSGWLAYGGNWFFLADPGAADVAGAPVSELLAVARAISRVLREAGTASACGHAPDHVELFGPPRRADADSLNFVLCPGGEFDRSPCGTGTSAKVAALATEGRLEPGRPWRQEGIAGGLFECTYQPFGDGKVLPTLAGRAWISAVAELRLDPSDPMLGGLAWS